MLDETGNVIQETEYYAFGLAIPRTVGINKYLYNGKEKQPETEWLDYGARQYDPAISRWMIIDPLAELSIGVSGYAYVENDPIRKIDLFGLIDINNDGTDDGISLPEATVTGKRPDPLFCAV
ncbi:RHS repeat-associated core domain-containing protein [Dyadobacter sp. 676]|uniref:RHS repeat-associated core domain-containing protein n=1 Tax=Dyadobacter sp. 676 TaxID=3088362 RepID=A0AAU8FM63_9BACT